MEACKILLIGVIALAGCSIKPQAINYGNEVCAFCSMNIVDQRFGCESVTNKGKVYKFDAIECMVNFNSAHPDIYSNTELFLTNTLDKPGELINVESCRFLHSKSLPSPMGMFLNPVLENDFLKDLHLKNQGEIYTFTELSKLVLYHYKGLTKN